MQAILRQDFASFIERSFYELYPGKELSLAPYVEVIATKLDAVRRGAIKRLIINLPPRRLKSHCASVAFPAWVLGHNPTKNLLCISYGQNLADEMAASCSLLMRSQFYRNLFGGLLLKLAQGSDQRTAAGGGRLASSVGGALTGRGADIIIIDDPQKADESLIDADPRKIHAWYDQVLLSRLDNWCEGAIIIVMQRLGEDDLVGHVLKHGEWDVFALPIIAQSDEKHLIESPFGSRFFTRKRGDYLDPIRDNKVAIAPIKASLSEDAFASQYLQDPGLPSRMRARQTELDRRFSEAYRSGDALAIGRAWRDRTSFGVAEHMSDNDALESYREFFVIVERLNEQI